MRLIIRSSWKCLSLESGGHSLSVTVIMPFRNCVSSLSEMVWRKCLESISTQRYLDWTCILIDDCSKDNSSAIVESFKEKRFKLYRNREHIGLTRSLNKAIAMVDTPYIARHDSDDFSSKSRFKNQVQFLDENTNVSVLGTFAKLYSPDLVEYDSHEQPVTNAQIRNYIKRQNPMIHGSVMMRTNELKQLGGYNESFFVCQDYELWSRFVLANKVLHNMPEFLYNRVSHKACASKVYSKLKKEAVNRIRAMHKGTN